MNDIITLSADNTFVGQRIDKFITENTDDFTRSAVQRLIEEKKIFVNGSCVSKSYKMRENGVVEITVEEAKELECEAQDIPLDIVYEDDDLLVVNKPKGMVVHPAPGNSDSTLVNALLYHCKGSLSGINGVIRPGIVHRIDKDTSGLLIVAKNDSAHVSLAEQIKEHSFDRAYEAIVYGNIKDDEGTVDAPIGRHPVMRKKMAVTMKNSKNAVTHYKVIERFGKFTHVRLNLETGRTHQIRVHMAYIGHPVAGDPLYGPKKVITELDGQCLHAKKIGFIHPRTGEHLVFETPLPEYFQKFLNKLKNTSL